MNVTYDTIADAVYLSVGEGRVKNTLKLQKNLNVDMDGTGRIVGIEILEASSQESLVASLKKNVEAGIPISISQATPQLA